MNNAIPDSIVIQYWILINWFSRIDLIWCWLIGLWRDNSPPSPDPCNHSNNYQRADRQVVPAQVNVKEKIESEKSSINKEIQKLGR